MRKFVEDGGTVVALGAAIVHVVVWAMGWPWPHRFSAAMVLLLGLTWPVGLACFGVFLTVLSASRIVSLSSVVAAISLPLLMLGWFHDHAMGLRWPYLVLALLTSTLVIWRHRSNLQRLLAGTEPKLGQKKGA